VDLFGIMDQDLKKQMKRAEKILGLWWRHGGSQNTNDANFNHNGLVYRSRRIQLLFEVKKSIRTYSSAELILKKEIHRSRKRIGYTNLTIPKNGSL
jgi:hypothetical protein